MSRGFLKSTQLGALSAHCRTAWCWSPPPARSTVSSNLQLRLTSEIVKEIQIGFTEFETNRFHYCLGSFCQALDLWSCLEKKEAETPSTGSLQFRLERDGKGCIEWRFLSPSTLGYVCRWPRGMGKGWWVKLEAFGRRYFELGINFSVFMFFSSNGWARASSR